MRGVWVTAFYNCYRELWFWSSNIPFVVISEVLIMCILQFVILVCLSLEANMSLNANQKEQQQMCWLMMRYSRLFQWRPAARGGRDRAPIWRVLGAISLLLALCQRLRRQVINFFKQYILKKCLLTSFQPKSKKKVAEIRLVLQNSRGVKRKWRFCCPFWRFFKANVALCHSETLGALGRDE